jgi:hypothetical protein
MKTKPDILEGYCCPFCSDHEDFDFVWSELAGRHICLGCRCEIDQGLDYDQQPTTDEINCADTIVKLLEYLGIDYSELKQRQKKLAAKRRPRCLNNRNNHT